MTYNKSVAFTFALLWASLLAAQPKLLLHYDFHDVAGKSVKDLSGNHFDGTLKGSATAGHDGGLDFAFLSYEGGYIDMGAGIGDLLQRQRDFSVAARYKVDDKASLDGNGYFLWAFSTLEENTKDKGHYHAYKLNVQRAENSIGGWSQETILHINKPSKKGEWQLAVYTQRGSEGRLYLNGQLVAFNNDMFTKDTTFPNEAPLFNWIGRAPFHGDAFLAGTSISDFRIYNTALSEEEVKKLTLNLSSMSLSAYGQQVSNDIPADKKEVIDRFIAGTLDPSYTPALFYGHFGSGQKLGEGALKAHLGLFLKGGADILKIQTEQPMPRIQDLTMDSSLVPEDHYRPTVELIKDVLSYVGNDVYVMPTILSAHQLARQAFGDERLMKYAVERPEAYRRMLDSYTNAILWYIRECKAAGVDAFFMATQGGEKKFYDLKVPGGFFETWIRPYDLKVMGECDKGTRLTVLHICDWEGPMDDLTRYFDYPGKIVNAPLAIDGKPLSPADTYKLFKRPVLGGFNRKEFGKMTPEAIKAMTRQLIDSGPRGHMMIGADCSVPSPLQITANIHAAVSTAHGR